MPLMRLRSPEAAARWLNSWVTGTLRTDSRRVQPGDAFIAWPGYATDGRQYVRDALAAGATTCIVEDDGVEAFGFDDARIATLPGLKAATGVIAAEWYGHPSRALRMLAVTGTNGKTSTAWWTAQALSLLGQRAAVVGTLGIGEPPAPAVAQGQPGALGSIVATGLTTPDPVVLQAGLRDMVDNDYAACAIEASSIGVVEHRLAGMAVEVALFTNFTQDHVDYHGSMEAYWAAKRALFDWAGLKSAVIHVDDAKGAALVAELAGHGLALWTVAVHSDARLRAEGVRYGQRGLAFTVVEGDERVDIETALIGDYNVANLLVVIGGLRAVGIGLFDAAQAAAQVTPVPGRMQRVPSPAAELPEVVVDYAHTPDALEKAVVALRPLAQARGGRLWCVFGCGGDRDATKRPLMGGIAARHADHVMVTSDNPRTEDPLAIVEQIVDGIPGGRGYGPLLVQPDRRQAIRAALAQASSADVVLIAGKGHEDYQEVHGQRHPFSDVEEAAAALSHRATAPVLPTTPPMSTLGELHALLEARLPGCRLIGEPATPVWRVHTDTRTLAAGDLFVALKGERFDAHDFLPGAAASGATAVVGERGVADCGLPGIEVPDTLRALQALGAGWRAAHALPVIGVTGSNGKTTVTQMTAAILRAEAGDHALATAGNLNNHIGVPMTVLRLADHRLAVVELGMNHPGEIAELAAIAAPTVALVNNAQREHLEFMRTVQAVAKENGSVISALPTDGVAVFPADDVYTPLWREMADGRRTLTFALDDDDDAAALHVKADLRAAAQWQVDHWQVQMRTPAGEASVALHVAGRHMVKNALAATACALAAGVPLASVVRGLEAFRPVKGRAQVHRLSGAQGEATLIDDSYNANPDSVRAAIDVLATLPEPGWLVLGDMGEVGDEGPAFHAEAGAHALAAGLPNFWCAGAACVHAAQAYGPGARHFATVDDLIAALDEAPAHAAVLVKGSRFMRMERVVEALRQRAGGPQGGAHAA